MIGQALIEGREDDAVSWLNKHLEVLEDEGFYLEVIPSGTDDQDQINQGYLRLSKDHGVPLVAANRCMYMDRTDARTHEVLSLIHI